MVRSRNRIYPTLALVISTAMAVRILFYTDTYAYGKETVAPAKRSDFANSLDSALPPAPRKNYFAALDLSQLSAVPGIVMQQAGAIADSLPSAPQAPLPKPAAPAKKQEASSGLDIAGAIAAYWNRFSQLSNLLVDQTASLAEAVGSAFQGSVASIPKAPAAVVLAPVASAPVSQPASTSPASTGVTVAVLPDTLDSSSDVNAGAPDPAAPLPPIVPPSLPTALAKVADTNSITNEQINAKFIAIANNLSAQVSAVASAFYNGVAKPDVTDPSFGQIVYQPQINALAAALGNNTAFSGDLDGTFTGAVSGSSVDATQLSVEGASNLATTTLTNLTVTDDATSTFAGNVSAVSYYGDGSHLTGINAGTGSPSGSEGQIQFNSSDMFGASAGLTFDGTTLSTSGLTVVGTSTLSGPLSAATTTVSNLVVTGAATSTISGGLSVGSICAGAYYGDGSHLTGISGGITTPGGLNTQIQFNSSGSFAGNAGLTFDGTTFRAPAFSAATSTLTNLTVTNVATSTFAGNVCSAGAISAMTYYGDGSHLTGITGGGGGGTPSGADGDIQYNTGGTFSGYDAFAFDGSTMTVPNICASSLIQANTVCTYGLYVNGMNYSNVSPCSSGVLYNNYNQVASGGFNFSYDDSICTLNISHITACTIAGSTGTLAINSDAQFQGGNNLYGGRDLSSANSGICGSYIRDFNYLCIGLVTDCDSAETQSLHADGVIVAANYHTGYTDLAENYPTNDPTLSPGEIVAVDPNLNEGVKRASAGDAVLLGIITTKPGVTLGAGKDAKAIALAGRIPVKVNLEGGSIAIGDRITISSVPGIGKKAAAGDQSVGVALQAFPRTDTFGASEGTVVAFAENNQPQALASSFASANQPGTDIVISALASFGANIKNGIATFMNVVADKVTAKEIVVNTLTIKNDADVSKTGFVIYDRGSGQPVCVFVINGALQTSPGNCDVSGAQNSGGGNSGSGSNSGGTSTSTPDTLPSDNSGTASTTATTTSPDLGNSSGTVTGTTTPDSGSGSDSTTPPPSPTISTPAPADSSGTSTPAQ